MLEKILIIGPLGQDGNLLCSILPKNEYEIWGICKPDTNDSRIDTFREKYSINIVKSDFTEYKNVKTCLSEIKPNIIVNFAGLTNVFNPWENLDNIYELNCKLPLNVLRYISENNTNIFFVQSSSSLMYGNSNQIKIDEKSPLSPLYPYGITKAFVHNYIQEFRKKYNVKCSSLILFNHESPYRNENFLSKKLAIFIAKILKGESETLQLGNLSAIKDISHAYDFMVGLKMIIEKKINDDFVLSSGVRIKTYDFVERFFNLYNLDMQKYVKFVPDERNETLNIFGDNTKLKKIGWQPKYDVNKLINEMVNYELWK